MDQETFTNHLSRMGKPNFDIACRIMLRSVFGLKAVNVDGMNDGGTDFSAFTHTGERISAAYQVTTQKTDIRGKAFRDAKKAIEKLNAEKFYYFTTLAISETEARKLEARISTELGIQAICLGSRHIAGLIIEEGLLTEFLDEANYPLPRGFASNPDHRTMALHAYTLMSKDARDMRTGIYDDTIVFILSETLGMGEAELIARSQEFLGNSAVSSESLKSRISSLFSRQVIRKLQDGSITLGENSRRDIEARKRLYEGELTDLAAAQVDLMRNEFKTDWSVEDSRAVSVFIAGVYISRQIELLKDIQASIVVNPIFQGSGTGEDSLKRYLKNNRKVAAADIDVATNRLIELAAHHPLINKLARASVYVALEGANPIVSAKALGAGRWSDMKILLEPTVAIPWICSHLYKGRVNSKFDASVESVIRARKLDSSCHITYFYINECAGHLLQARKYANVRLSDEELRFSQNAYVANYYSLKSQGVRVPDTLFNYLKTFSPAILIEQSDIVSWSRTIMTDLQAILTRSGVTFAEAPHYDHAACATFEKDYTYYIEKYRMDKPKRLIDNDIWALQFTRDKIVRGEHWLILTHDRSLIYIGQGDTYPGWITTPDRFMDLTETQRPLAESQYISLLHSVASYSERTLSAGARIIDRVIQYASNEMQNWEFQEELDIFRRELVSDIDLTSPNLWASIDARTDEFLESHGVSLSLRDSSSAEDLAL